jgi:hypothetical protein
MMKKKNQKMKISKIFLIILLANQTIAQQFGTTAKIANIKTDGLYSVLLTPEIRSFTKEDLRDLRIFDAANKEVPYFIWKETINNATTNFEEFTIVSREIIANVATQIVIENAGSKTLDEIVLNITNSKLIKTCNISGSDDQKQWFGLLDKFQFPDLENKDSTNVFTRIKLPPSTYHYIKFEINDKKTAPINILKIGNFKHSLLGSKMQFVMPNDIKTATDSKQKKTQIKVSFSQPQIIENIAFEIQKPNFYKRNARILVNRTKFRRNKTSENYLETIVEFELNSAKNNTFDIPTLFEKEFIIEIDNEDNSTLTITNLKFSQLSTYLVSDFKAAENYTLKTGNDSLTAPNYDISFFKNSISMQLPEANIAEIKTILNVSETPNKDISFWQNSWFLWLCISIAGMVIAYFSTTLLRDLNKK